MFNTLLLLALDKRVECSDTTSPSRRQGPFSDVLSWAVCSEGLASGPWFMSVMSAADSIPALGPCANVGWQQHRSGALAAESSQSEFPET